MPVKLNAPVGLCAQRQAFRLRAYHLPISPPYTRYRCGYDSQHRLAAARE